MTQVQFSIPHAVLKPYSKDDIHAALQDNPKLAKEAIFAIWKLNQSEEEKSAQATYLKNGVGFNSFDAKFASDLARQVGEGKKMSHKQMRFVFKFAHKYAGQVADILNAGVVEAPTPAPKVRTILRRRK